MKTKTIALAALLLTACANSPDRPASVALADGQSWVISFVSSGVTGSTHLLVNGERVASGSFGLVAGNKASGSGTFRGHEVFFSCAHRYSPTCLVYVDGQQAAEVRYQDQAAP